MQESPTDFQDFMIGRVDKVLSMAGETDECQKAQAKNSANYDTLFASLSNEEQKKLLEKLCDEDLVRGIYCLRCYHAGLLDGIALGAKALLRGGAFDA
jgi:uncharacterized protein with von Willebrand factor type A (vWA) domain